MQDNPEGYFLSATNPVANIDQRDLERLTLKLLARPDIQAAKNRAREMFRRVTDRIYPTEQVARTEATLSNYWVKSTMVAANTDANYPRVLRVYTPAATWLGHDVPGSKWGGDNPDNAYRLIPISSDGVYELHGQRQNQPSTYVTYQLVGNSCTSITMGSLEQLDIDINNDGSYVITLDATPANGRRNHFMVPPGTLYLFIRDSLGDWETQQPDALRIKRLNAPTRGPLTEDELARTAVTNIHSDVFYHYYAGRLFFNAPQIMLPPEGAGGVGGLVTQQGSLGHFTLADDEVVIITATEGGATYRSVVLHDLFLLSLENRDHLTSFNNAQVIPDQDGRVTYVISVNDPGVHNWLDTTGLRDTLVLYRWQGFPLRNSPPPLIESRKVNLSELAAALPPGVARVNPTDRAAQIDRRQKSYDRRFAFD